MAVRKETVDMTEGEMKEAIWEWLNNHYPPGPSDKDKAWDVELKVMTSPLDVKQFSARGSR